MCCSEKLISFKLNHKVNIRNYGMEMQAYNLHFFYSKSKDYVQQQDEAKSKHLFVPSRILMEYLQPK